MGAKYIPTVKDQKALQRYQGKQNPGKPGFKKPASTQPAAPKKPAGQG
jgi:hypothetical protein